MRVSNLLIMGALSALVFTGCTNNDDNSEWLDSNSVTFNSRIDGLQTKASKDVWSNGDEVGIFMTTQTAEFANKKYVASDGGTLTAAPGQTLRYPMVEYRVPFIFFTTDQYLHFTEGNIDEG